MTQPVPPGMRPFVNDYSLSQLLGYVETTTQQADILDFGTDIDGLSLTVVINAPRRVLRLSALVHYNLIGSHTETIALRIVEGATQLQRVNDSRLQPVSGEGTPYGTGYCVAIVVDPSVGEHTYKVQMHAATLTNSFDVEGSDAQRNYLMVEDIGTVP